MPKAGLCTGLGANLGRKKGRSTVLWCHWYIRFGPLVKGSSKSLRKVLPHFPKLNETTPSKWSNLGRIIREAPRQGEIKWGGRGQAPHFLPCQKYNLSNPQRNLIVLHSHFPLSWPLISCSGYRSIWVRFKQPGNNCRVSIFIVLVLKDLEILFPALIQRTELLRFWRLRSIETLDQAGLVQPGRRMAAYFMQQALPRTSQGHTYTARHYPFIGEILSCSLQIYYRYAYSKLSKQKGVGMLKFCRSA